MGGRVCEICGVREKQRSGFFANFPLDENRCKEWVRVVGKQDLVHVPIEKLHEIRFICGDHFVKKDFNKKGNRLLKRAIPKLKLISAPLSDDHLEVFPLHVASKIDPDVRDQTTDVQPASSTSQQEIILHSTQQTTPKKRKYAEPVKDDEIKMRKVEDNSAVLPGCIQFPELNIPEEMEIDNETDLTDIKLQPLIYVSGYLASTLKNLNCVACRSLLIEEDEEKQQAEIYQYIQLREWWDDKRSLTYPSLPLCRMLETAVNVFETEIIPKLHEHNISALCTTLFVFNCDTTWFTCTHTKLIFDAIFGRLGRLLIRRQCHRINLKFAESEERIKDISKKAEQGVS